MGENCKSAPVPDNDEIRVYDKPRVKDAGFLVLKGNLFDSAIMKTSVISEEFRDRYLSNPKDPNAFEGRAIVFDGPEDYHCRIDDPSLNIDEHTILFMRGGGPIGYPGAAEVVNMQPPAALIKRGITSLPCIGDGRQSGTSGSPSILNASPEAAANGGLALVRTGDKVRIDLNKRTADILVTDDEITRRRAELQNNGGYKYPEHQTPWQEIQRGLVGELESGAVLEGAVKYQRIAQTKGIPRADPAWRANCPGDLRGPPEFTYGRTEPKNAFEIRDVTCVSRCVQSCAHRKPSVRDVRQDARQVDLMALERNEPHRQQKCAGGGLPAVPDLLQQAFADRPAGRREIDIEMRQPGHQRLVVDGRRGRDQRDLPPDLQSEGPDIAVERGREGFVRCEERGRPPFRIRQQCLPLSRKVSVLAIEHMHVPRCEPGADRRAAERPRHQLLEIHPRVPGQQRDPPVPLLGKTHRRIRRDVLHVEIDEASCRDPLAPPQHHMTHAGLVEEFQPRIRRNGMRDDQRIGDMASHHPAQMLERMLVRCLQQHDQIDILAQQHPARAFQKPEQTAIR